MIKRLFVSIVVATLLSSIFPNKGIPASVILVNALLLLMLCLIIDNHTSKLSESMLESYGVRNPKFIKRVYNAKSRLWQKITIDLFVSTVLLLISAIGTFNVIAHVVAPIDFTVKLKIDFLVAVFSTILIMGLIYEIVQLVRFEKYIVSKTKKDKEKRN